jgi:hypothetical protein
MCPAFPTLKGSGSFAEKEFVLFHPSFESYNWALSSGIVSA